MVVLLNPCARQGRGEAKWELVRKMFDIYQPEVASIRNAEWRMEMKLHIQRGETRFIAVGGDGTVNLLLNTLLRFVQLEELRNYTLGAVGTGSSNDFHKPVSSCVAGIPIAADFDNTYLRDICSLDYEAGRRYFIINASIGITAEANYRFNHPGLFLRLLKKLHTGSAIICAAVTTAAGYKNKKMLLTGGDVSELYQVTNLGVVKNPHFSGDFCYDHDAVYNDGLLQVHLAYDYRKGEIPGLMTALTKGKFSELRKTKSSLTGEYTVTSENEFTVECDGETVRSKTAKFTVYKEAIRVCR